MICISLGIAFPLIVTIVTVWSGYRHINNLWSVGPFYWIMRDLTSPKYKISVSLGFMRQTTSPWRVGRGIQIQVSRYAYQIGLCRKSNNRDDQSGLLFAVKGRILETPITEIGDWQ